MPARRLSAKLVEKPWGRVDLPPAHAALASGKAIGELWFEAEDDHPLLVKYLFTGEDLSVQVHPDDARAQAAGYQRGKDEAWVIVEAGARATIALGLDGHHGRGAVAAAAQDGTIMGILDHRPVAAGDVIYSPAGTVHAIGAGLALVEVQQNVDITYRLYDHGRPRELHLEEGLSVAKLVRFDGQATTLPTELGRARLVQGNAFGLDLITGPHSAQLQDMVWLIPLQGRVMIDGNLGVAGECWFADDKAVVDVPDGARLLLAIPV